MIRVPEIPQSALAVKEPEPMVRLAPEAIPRALQLLLAEAIKG